MVREIFVAEQVDKRTMEPDPGSEPGIVQLIEMAGKDFARLTDKLQPILRPPIYCTGPNICSGLVPEPPKSDLREEATRLIQAINYISERIEL